MMKSVSESTGMTDLKLAIATQAQALGMALHELATNAGKYGALSSGEGQVVISWNVEERNDHRVFHMRWEESGGPPVTAPVHAGFGTRLLAEMTELALNGRVHLEYAPEGFRWSVAADAEKVIEICRAIAEDPQDFN
jgi:two-component sensor histidine kinase